MPKLDFLSPLLGRGNKARDEAELRVLMVCMGNICRSPTAQGVFERMLEEQGLAERIYVDSAGTHAYHVGARPDPRAVACAQRRGIDLRRLRARAVAEEDFTVFEYIVAMDEQNLADLRQACPEPEGVSRISTLLSFAADSSEVDVPDPYYGGPSGFERVLDLVEEGAMGLLMELRRRHRL